MPRGEDETLLLGSSRLEQRFTDSGTSTTPNVSLIFSRGQGSNFRELEVESVAFLRFDLVSAYYYPYVVLLVCFYVQLFVIRMATEQPKAAKEDAPKLVKEDAKIDLFEDDDEFEEFEIDQGYSLISSINFVIDFVFVRSRIANYNVLKTGRTRAGIILLI